MEDLPGGAGAGEGRLKVLYFILWLSAPFFTLPYLTLPYQTSLLNHFHLSSSTHNHHLLDSGLTL